MLQGLIPLKKSAPHVLLTRFLYVSGTEVLRFSPHVEGVEAAVFTRNQGLSMPCNQRHKVVRMICLILHTKWRMTTERAKQWAALLFAATTLHWSGSAAAIPSAERNFLLALYTSTSGASWLDKTGWNGPVGTECNWYGITCNNDASNVTRIVLNNNKLAGSLPSTLNSLTKLSIFSVAENQLVGTLPVLTGLTDLREFFVEKNRLTGAIPSLAGLASLTWFHAYSNELEGSIPTLSQLTSMVSVQVHNNRLTGVVPNPPPSLFQSSSVLCPNPLTITANAAWDIATPGALWSSNCSSIPGSERNALITLYDSTNGPSWSTAYGWGGVIGSECGWYGVHCNAEKTHVIRLQLNGNSLSGSIPASISQLPFLQTINIYENAIDGTIPSLSMLTQLREFIANQNRFTGNIPALTGLTQLQDFRFFSNQLSGSLPAFINLPALKYFYANDNALNGTIPPLASATSLVDFFINDNALAGSIPSLSTLAELQRFRVENNQLTGPVPDAPPSLVQEGSRLCRNSLDYSSSDSIKNTAWNNATPGASWHPLCFAIPDSERAVLLALYNGTNLLNGSTSSWRFSTNWLGPAGTECYWLGITCDASQRNVIAIDLGNNNLIGNLPSNLRDLTKLTSLMVQANKLTGPLPSISGMQYLSRFLVGANELTGPIPALTQLPALTEFLVAQNQLTGAIPTLTGLPALREVRVESNQLSGAVPLAPTTLSANNSMLCPNQLIPSANAAWDSATPGASWSTDCVSARQPQSLIFDSPPLLLVGQSAMVRAIATPASGSTAPIRYSALTSRVCTVDAQSGLVTVSAGSSGQICSVAADRAGDTAYNAAPQAKLTSVVISSCRLDVNDDRQLDAHTDGLLISRYLAGFRGSALLSGLNPLLGNRNTATAIESFLAAQNLDVQGNSTSRRPTLDGLAIHRHLLGHGEAAMIAGTGIPVSRASEVKARISQWCGR